MRTTRIAAVAAALATTVPALTAGNALAASPTTFNYTGAQQTYTVPAGAHFLSASAVGGRGGNSPYLGGQGGRGGRVAATLPVTPGQTLYINVGGNGTSGANAPGGFNGGGGQREYAGGGAGGGASDIRSVSGDLNSRLLVAGGGGGAGSGYDRNANGGDAGMTAGQNGLGSNGYGSAGAGGTSNAGGAGGPAPGIVAGADGALGMGGLAGLYAYPPYYAAGGGGGGYYGGGGGGAFAAGGGGSSYIMTQATGTAFSVDSTGAPSVTVTALGVLADQSSVTFASTPQSTISAGQDIEFTNTTAEPVDLGDEQFAGANEDDFYLTRNTCHGLLASGASCSLRVKFSPATRGARNATLTLPAEMETAGDDVSVTVALSGTGGDLPTGAQGPQGDTGNTGNTGAQGPQGDTGNTGTQGPQGDTGNTGAQGTTGKDGVNGTDGAKGEKGEKGEKGVTVKFAKRGKTRVGCKVSARGAGSRIVCDFNRRSGRNWVVQLRDRRGALSAAAGNGKSTMVFLTARKPRGSLHAFVIKGLPTS